jgi:DNA-directed RNA polymerase subunit omega
LRLNFVSGTVAAPIGITNPPIDELLDKASSKYALVIIGAKRARQINSYYSQLSEGLLEYVGPVVETRPQEKALSIALREVNADMLTFEPINPMETAAAEAVVSRA